MADCSDCLELVTEDGQDQGDYRGHCLQCRREITAQGPGPGAPYTGDPRASGGAALKWCLKGLPALFQ